MTIREALIKMFDNGDFKRLLASCKNSERRDIEVDYNLTNYLKFHTNTLMNDKTYLIEQLHSKSVCKVLLHYLSEDEK